jgi:hypothetical protein
MRNNPESPFAIDVESLEFAFSGEVFAWRGPAPYYFISVPEEACVGIHAVAPVVTYGWGVIPVSVQIGLTTWKTSLFPKDGGYLVPIKDAVRKAEGLAEGDTATVNLAIRS